MNVNTLAFGAIIIVSFFWASVGVVTKILLLEMSAYTIAFCRFLFASIILMIIMILNKVRLNRKIVLSLLPIAFLSTLNIVFFYLGIKITTVINSAMIYATTPLLVAVYSYLWLKEKMTKRKIFGLLIGFIGVMFIILLPLFQGNSTISGSIAGNFFICLATLCWSFYTVKSSEIIKRKIASALDLTCLSIFTTAVTFSPMLFSFNQKVIEVVLTLTNLSLIVYLAIFSTITTYFLYQWAMKHISVTSATLTFYLQPLFAIILSILILGEKLSPGFIIGGLLVILGVYLTNRGTDRKIASY